MEATLRDAKDVETPSGRRTKIAAEVSATAIKLAGTSGTSSHPMKMRIHVRFDITDIHSVREVKACQ